MMPANPVPLKIAWISDFPLEWLPDLPEPLGHLPRGHPSTWQRVLLSELEKLPDIHLHVVILRKQIARDFQFQRGGVTFHVVKVPGKVRAPSFFWVDTRAIQRVLKLIQPDLVHAWGTERGAALVASRLGYPYLATVQGLLTWYRECTPLTLYEHFSARLETISLQRAKFATAESSFPTRYLKERYPQLRVHHVEYAPQQLFQRVERRPQTRPVRFIFVGTVGYRKGSDLLLRALNQLVSEFEFELHIIGHPDESFLAPWKQSLSPELFQRLTFRENLEPDEIARELATATIMVFPTRADTGPMAVKEAASAGVPIVASHIGGVPDYVKPELNGFLFPSGDLNELVAAIRQAVQHPLFGRGMVDPATLAEVRDYLSTSRMGEGFFKIYQEIAQLSRSGSSRL